MTHLIPIPPKRFIGLDVHKHYLIAFGVDQDLNIVLPAHRVELFNLESWMKKSLSKQDAVALEMTTNTWELYDELSPCTHSVTVVHPQHIALITHAQVMTDKIAAAILARFLAKGLLTAVWVPPVEIRELRALVAQRGKMVRLATQAKNRLHSVLQRHHILPPEGGLFLEDQKEWWSSLPLGKLEKVNLQSDLDTLHFAGTQLTHFETIMNEMSAKNQDVTRLIHLPGFGVILALTVYAAIGDIARFEDAKHLVGYSGLGARIHDSGLTTRTGRITKSGRKDLRFALVEAAQAASRSHPHWKAELARLEPRLGRNKAIVAIARKLLVAVWFVLSRKTADRFVQPDQVARKLLRFAYKVGTHNLPDDQSAGQFIRRYMDDLKFGAEISAITSKSKRPIHLPPSSLL